MLKRVEVEFRSRDIVAAAFGRLCVETSNISYSHIVDWAAAFGRLCVETTSNC